MDLDDFLLSEFFALSLQEKPDNGLPEPLTIEEIAKRILDQQCQRIVVMIGAGTSTSAGIPDFRSPTTGLYSNLQKYNLPYPEAIFDIDYFHERPEPFFTLAKELYPGKFEPTQTHYFIRLLAEKGILKRLYTQNIDTLERRAGIQEDLIIEAHGSFHSASCVNGECMKSYNHGDIEYQIFNDIVPRCNDCGDLVKPDIVFFGENLPERFYKHLSSDFEECDLLIVIGTSLTVHPFASLIAKPKATVPRLLINMERCGERMRGGFDFEKTAHRDLALLGPCDSGCMRLIELLGWQELFNSYYKDD